MPNPSRIALTVAAVDAIGAQQPTPVCALTAAGVTRGQIRAALQAGGLTAIGPGIVVSAHRWSAADGDERHALLVRAALLRYPGAIVSHHSAARAWGLPDVGRSPAERTRVHITKPASAHRSSGLVVHGDHLPAEQCTTIDELPVTSLGRTFVDLVPTATRPHRVALADAALRRTIGGTAHPTVVRHRVRDDRLRRRAHDEVDALLSALVGRTGVNAARAALSIADPAAESVLESYSRAGLIDAGFPAPQCGLPVVGDDGRTYWADMAWPEYRLIAEVDGELKYVVGEDLLREKRRQEAIEAAGWVVVRWGWREAVIEPHRMLERLERFLVRRVA